MTRCVVHMGMHKTGTTSIQESLNNLEDDKFVYAKLGNYANHSLPVYSAFADNPASHHLHRASRRDDDAVRAYVARVWADFDRSFAKARGRTLLISGEDIGVLPDRLLIKLRDYLRGRVDEVKVVGYVRSPAGFVQSHFQQRVKSATVRSFDPEAMYRSYRDSFEKFDTVFGRENVTLWKFNPAAFSEGCVVQDFCARLGIRFPKQRIVRLNESLSRQATAALYTYAKFGEHYGARNITGGAGMRLGQLIGGTDKFRFSPDVLRPAIDKYREDIEWMEARLGEPLQEELEQYRPGDVREEADLLRPEAALVGRLLQLLGDTAPKDIKGDTPEEVASLVHALCEKHVPLAERQRREAAPHKNAPVQLADLIDQVRQTSPALLNGMSRDEANALLREVFKHMNQKLAQAEEGFVNFAGLGRFRIAKVETNANGEKSVQTRIIFRPAGSE
jgi:nucleoid DNA-binding protein